MLLFNNVEFSAKNNFISAFAFKPLNINDLYSTVKYFISCLLSYRYDQLQLISQALESVVWLVIKTKISIKNGPAIVLLRELEHVEFKA